MSGEERLYYDAEGFAVTLGYERYGPVSPLRTEMERVKRLICRSLDYSVRDMSDMILAEALKGIYAVLASAIEARSDATGTGAAEGESAGPQDDAR